MDIESIVGSTFSGTMLEFVIYVYDQRLPSNRQSDPYLRYT
jgi:hypothetical protein